MTLKHQLINCLGLQFTNPVDALNAVELLNGKIFGDKEIRARLDRGSRGSGAAAAPSAPAPSAAAAAPGEGKQRARKEKAAVDPDAPKQVDSKRVFVSNLTWDTTEEVPPRPLIFMPTGCICSS
jgi:RNA recognition motif-containing protein